MKTIGSETGYPSRDRKHLKGVSFAKLHPLIILMSLFKLFTMINGKVLDEIAISRGSVSYTRRQVRDDALLMMKALSALGLVAGDTLSIATPNLVEGIILTLAANAIGIKVAYHNGDDEAFEQLCEELVMHGSKAVVVYDEDTKYAKRLTKAVPTLETVINISSDGVENGYEAISEDKEMVWAAQIHEWKHAEKEIGPPSVLFRAFKVTKHYRRCRFVSYSSMRFIASFNNEKIEPKIRKNLTNRKGLIFLQTSGSTSGKPKYPVFSNRSVVAALTYAANSTGTERHDKNVKKVLCVLPYRLPYGWMTIFVNLLGGNRVELATGATPEDIGHYWGLKPSYIYGTPQMFSDFMEQTPDDADLSFLVAFFCSGFATSESKIQKGYDFLRAHNSEAEIRVNFGIGEMMCVGTASDNFEHVPGSSGKFYYGPTWVIVDENLHEVKYGEIGEILVRSKSAFLGYYNDPEATEQAFVTYRGKKFYRTGDFAMLAQDGNVYYHGRKKRFYQPRGATDKVNCETIERALDDIEMVKRNAVVICSLDGKSETSQAFVVLRDGLEASDELKVRILELLKQRLLKFQMPSRVEFVDQLPEMKSGKINYSLLESLCPQLESG